MSKKNRFLLGLALFSICAFIFLKAISYGYVPYDDPAYVTDNPYVSDGLTSDGIRWAFLYDSQPGDLKYAGVENLWHPFTWISHMIDVQLFGVEGVYGHHAVSIGLYFVTAILVMWVSGMLLGNVWAGFFVAILWMVHPLKVESVVWVSERKDVLSGVFFWASLGFVLRSKNYKGLWYWCGYILFIAALLSKPSAVVLPALLVLLIGYLNKENKWDWNFFIKSFKTWWLWFLTAGVLSVIAIYMQAGGSHEFFIEQSSIINRVVVGATGFWFYIWRILVPLNLSFEYNLPNIPLWCHGISWLALSGVSVLVWIKRNNWRLVFFGYAWFFICWLPVSGLIYIGSSFTADRYMYLALAGLLFPLVKWLGNVQWNKIVVSALCVIYSILSWKQVGVWKDGWTLYTHTTQVRPNVVNGWVNLGVLYKRDNLIDEAVMCYDKALALNELNYMAWHNLAVLKKKLNQPLESELAYQKALEIYPEFLPSLLNLGILKLESGDVSQARDLFQIGIGKDINMMWLCCKSEFELKNFERARALLQQLKLLDVQHQEIKQGMKKMSDYFIKMEDSM